MEHLDLENSTEGHDEGFQQFWKLATEVYDVILFDMQKYINSESSDTLYIEINHRC